MKSENSRSAASLTSMKKSYVSSARERFTGDLTRERRSWSLEGASKRKEPRRVVRAFPTLVVIVPQDPAGFFFSSG